MNPEAALSMKASFWVVGVSALLMLGCQTGEVYVTPPLHGKVIDSESGAPLADVVVTVWSTEQPDLRQTGKSDEQGGINLPGLKGRLRSTFPFVADRVMPPAIARFEAEGYVPKQIDSNADYLLFEGKRPIRLMRAEVE
jgi:hypothetical protein